MLGSKGMGAGTNHYNQCCVGCNKTHEGRLPSAPIPAGDVRGYVLLVACITARPRSGPRTWRWSWDCLKVLGWEVTPAERSWWMIQVVLGRWFPSLSSMCCTVSERPATAWLTLFGFGASADAHFLAFLLRRSENTSGTDSFLFKQRFKLLFHSCSLPHTPKISGKEGEGEIRTFSFVESLNQPVCSELPCRSLLWSSGKFGLCFHTVSCYSCQPPCTPQHRGNESCPTFNFEVLYKLLSVNALLLCIYQELEMTMWSCWKSSVWVDGLEAKAYTALPCSPTCFNVYRLDLWGFELI